MYFLFKIDLNAINEYFEISGKMKKKKNQEYVSSQWAIVKSYNF